MRGRRISAMVSPAEGALLFARSDARDHNWFALTPRADLDSIDRDSVATEAIPMIRSVVGVADLDITIHSAMTWSTGAFIADRYRAGRIFLVGDAAHLMPPYGGFGGNTGIADAHNLAWKLAAVCTGEAGDALLDTYESERQPITEFTLKHVMQRAGDGTGEFFRQFDQFDPNPITLGFRYPMATAVGFDRELPIEDPAQPSGQPGTRTPHIALKGATSSTLDLLDPGAFTFLAPDASSYASTLRTHRNDAEARPRARDRHRSNGCGGYGRPGCPVGAPQGRGVPIDPAPAPSAAARRPVRQPGPLERFPDCWPPASGPRIAPP
jgi:putative polyketide hydroxylase